MANRVRGGETSAQREDAQQRVPTKALTEDEANGGPPYVSAKRTHFIFE